MAKHLQTDLERLKRMVLELGTKIEEGLARAITSLNSHNQELAQQVVQGDEEIDYQEVLIEEECLKILALHQPVAKDLRFVVAVLKLNSDLERVGDLAVNIAERTIALSENRAIPIPVEINIMATKTSAMVKKSLDALIESDVGMASAVCSSDDEVDKIHASLYTSFQAMIKQDMPHLDQYLQLLSVSRYLERIADQATNIAEDVIYMVEGEVIRHHRDM
jgi:phosphate transport system protein